MKMNFNVIASGSSGNCYCIENNGHFIFVDAGATLTSIRKGLENRKPDRYIHQRAQQQF